MISNSPAAVQPEPHDEFAELDAITLDDRLPPAATVTLDDSSIRLLSDEENAVEIDAELRRPPTAAQREAKAELKALRAQAERDLAEFEAALAAAAQAGARPPPRVRRFAMEQCAELARKFGWDKYALHLHLNPPTKAQREAEELRSLNEEIEEALHDAAAQDWEAVDAEAKRIAAEIIADDFTDDNGGLTLRWTPADPKRDLTRDRYWHLRHGQWVIHDPEQEVRRRELPYGVTIDDVMEALWEVVNDAGEAYDYVW